MITYIILTYLLFGIIIVFIGPVAKEVNREVFKTWKNRRVYQSYNANSGKSKTPSLIVISAIYFFIEIITWPFLIFSYFAGKKERSKQEEIEEKNSEDLIKQWELEQEKYKGKLFLFRETGVGDLICKRCNYVEKITVSIHGGPDASKKVMFWRGYQCQACGKFETLTNPSSDNEYKCKCGGQQLDSEQVFCPQCGSKEVKYEIAYLT